MKLKGTDQNSKAIGKKLGTVPNFLMVGGDAVKIGDCPQFFVRGVDDKTT